MMLNPKNKSSLYFGYHDLFRYRNGMPIDTIPVNLAGLQPVALNPASGIALSKSRLKGGLLFN